MKKTILTMALTSLMLNSTYTIFNFAEENANKTANLPAPADVNQYVEQTAVIPKALLVSHDYNFTTDQFFKDMNTAVPNAYNYLMPNPNNGANQFIQNLTTNLDYQSTANVEANFVANGSGQPAIDELKQEQAKALTVINYANTKTITQYLSNNTLSNSGYDNAIETILSTLKNAHPEIVDYLQYVPTIKALVTELTTDWDQQSQWGANPLDAMKNYIHNSPEGDLAEAKTAGSKGEWYYVLTRANNWTWDDFYQYMAGVNFNYMFKVLTKGNPDFSNNGQYLGDIISSHITGSMYPSVDSNKIEALIGEALGKLSTTPAAWPYLINSVVPILKANPDFLNFGKNQTKAVTSLSWKGTSDQTGANVQQLLTEVTSLLQPNNEQKLIDLITPLLSSGNSTFAEDIIIKVKIAFVPAYYTLPEALNSFGRLVKSLKPANLAKSIADAVESAIQKQQPGSDKTIPEELQKLLNTMNQDIINNPIINLVDFKTNFDKIFNDNFNIAFNQLLDIINNPQTTKYDAKSVLARLGVSFDTSAPNFIPNSPLANLLQWINDKSSSFNQFLSIIANDQNTGIANTIWQRAEKQYQNLYAQYFDINNQTYFQVKNQSLIQQTQNSHKYYLLSYDLLNKNTKITYHVAFLTYDLTKPFLMNSFIQI